MAVTGTLTVLEAVTDAYRESGIIGMEESPDSSEITFGMKMLNRMLKSWQSRGYNLWTRATQSVALTTAASYSMSPVRPVRIHSVRYKSGSIETPMEKLTANEYDTLPDKTTTGTPTTWFYDKQREAALLYIWPLLSAASGQTLEITYEREIEDVDDKGAVLDVPGEWWDAVVYGLGERLTVALNVQNQGIAQMARDALFIALADDQEESIFFGEGPE
jgi:hypothetical protein